MARKISKKNVREARILGFTLLEVLVSLVILGIGLAFSTRVFVAGKYYIKEVENKNHAMEIASMRMNEYLSMSYKDLSDICAGVVHTDSGSDGDFNWTVTLTPASVADRLIPADTIPFVRIEVACDYNEPNVNGVVASKSVRLFNIVAYPYMHIYTFESAPTTIACAQHASIAQAVAANNPIIEMNFATEAKSNLLVFYNLTINITASGFDTDDLILTKCYVDGTAYEIQTGTPIRGQVSINNVVSVNALPSGNHNLKIFWYKDNPHGTIMGKKANLVVLQVEQ
jgi:prepilin-type N-terminal cleavage/methylation domain-containing protein